jgi:endo-1,4-beta-xylanase
MPDKTRRWRGLLAFSIGLSLGCGMPDKPDDTQVEAGSIVTPGPGNTDGGYLYSCTSDGGVSQMTPDGRNGYSVTWSNVTYLTCGKGWSVGTGHTVSYTGSYLNSGGGTFGLYGWTTNPTIEYYIVESTGDAGGLGQGTRMGTVVTDGDTYVVWRNQRVNQPCITGSSCTFYQYVSARQSKRTSGTITVQNHFDAWANLGMRLGTQNYQLLMTEAWNGSGSANVTLSEVGGGGGGGIPVAGGGGGIPVAGGGGGIPVAGGGGGIPIGGGGGGTTSSISIDAGGSSAVGTFTADRYFSGGSVYRNNAAIDLSKISGNVPPAVFNSERYGAMTYTIPNRSGAQKVTLYFAESYLSGPGQRRFSVAINGVKVLSDFDIFAAAGGRNKAVARTLDATANLKGQVVIQFIPVTQNPKVDALTVTGSAAIGPGGGGGGGGGGE